MHLQQKLIVFERAYCQVSTCSPFHTSLLTGRWPDTNHMWAIAMDEYWRNYTNATTIPQYFKENGYISVGMGKIFHPGVFNGHNDNAYSWSLPYYYHSPFQVTSANHVPVLPCTVPRWWCAAPAPLTSVTWLHHSSILWVAMHIIIINDISNTPNNIV